MIHIWKNFLKILSLIKNNISITIYWKFTTPSGNTINILQKYGDLYNFWYSLLLNDKSLHEIKLQQINFLRYLINTGGFGVYPNISESKKKSKHKAENIHLLLLGNPNKNFNDMLYLKAPTDQYNAVYLQARLLFDLRKEIYKRLTSKGIINNNYEDSIAERTKLRRQKFAEQPT